MLSAKQIAGCLLTGVIFSASSIPLAEAAEVRIGTQTLEVQTPTLSPGAGIRYTASGTGGTLTVHTEGFLFCTNFHPQLSSAITLVPSHETQGVNPAHAWRMPTATDVTAFGYSGSSLHINRDGVGAASSGLVCRAVGSQSEIPSGLTEYIFGHAFDPANPTARNYHNLVNWKSPPGFDWTLASNWSYVPTDACRSNGNMPAQVEEDVACAAVTGVRQAGVRAPVMWTWLSDSGLEFTYLFRVDARFGPQPVTIGGLANVSLPFADGGDEINAAGQLQLSIRDAYDTKYLSSAARFCTFSLADLPSTLGASTCPMTGSTGWAFDGPLDQPLSLSEPPMGQMEKSFYIAVTRKVTGVPADMGTPVVGAAIFVEPAAVGGDNFIGDDVVFGFPATSTGFPWMSGQ